MRRALFHAARAEGVTTPNPMVGAVVVSPDGVVVGQGRHPRAGEPHAEVFALEDAGARARGATIYVNLEPCCHTGRTGPCTKRIIAAGVSRVVTAMTDPNPLVSGKGIAELRANGIHVDVGVLNDEAARLNRAFTLVQTEGRPMVIAKAAMSADRMIAAAPGVRTQITSTDANRRTQRLRASVDAIGVGSGTLLADDPLLTARGAYRDRPLARVIFDRTLRTPPDAQVLSTRDAGPVIIVTTEQCAGGPDARRRLEEQGAEIEVARDGTLRAAMERLGARQIESVVLEGGAKIHHAAWDEQIADFVQLYVTPRVIGPGGVPFLDARVFSTAVLVDRRTEPLGPDVLIEGYVHRPH